MADMRDHRKTNCVIFETLCRRRATDAAAVFKACVLSYSNFPPGRTRREKLPHSFGKALNILTISFGSSFCFAFSSPCTGFLISETFYFGLLQGFLLDEDALSFISLSVLAPFQNYR
jgi:hypothetical protein